MRWLKLDFLYKYNLAVFLQRLLLTSIPPYLRSKLTFRHDLHDINIRLSNKLSLPKYRSALFQRSFTYNSVNIFNSIPDNVKSLPFNSFRTKIKSFFFNKQLSQ